MTKEKRLSADEFDALKAQPGRHLKKNLEAARLVLVDGKSPADVARQFSMSRQNLSRIVTDLYGDAKKKPVKPKLPKNWVRVAAVLPPSMAEEVRRMSQRAKESLLRGEYDD